MWIDVNTTLPDYEQLHPVSTGRDTSWGKRVMTNARGEHWRVIHPGGHFEDRTDVTHWYDLGIAP